MSRRSTGWMARPALLLVFAAILSFAVAIPAAADNAFTVNSVKDKVDANVGDGICADASGKCTLRAAIQEGNADGGAVTVDLPAGTFVLTRHDQFEIDDEAALGDLDLAADFEIVGAGQSATIIDGGALNRIFSVNDDYDLALAGLTLQNGKVKGGGGCLFVGHLTALTLDGIKMTRCTSGIGGALFVDFDSSVDIWLSTFSYNTGTTRGGAIALNGTISATVIESVFTGNKGQREGGAIQAATEGPVAIVASTFRDNSTVSLNGDGGALTISDAPTTILESRFIGNFSPDSGGAIRLLGTSGSIEDSLIQGNIAGSHGGGLYLYDSPNFYISGSAFVQNKVTGGDHVGGGIAVDGSYATVVNSTISGNRAGTGAGIHLYNSSVRSVGTNSARFAPMLYLYFTTVARNKAASSGGGIVVQAGSAEISRSIIAENSASPHADCVPIGITVTTTLIGDTEDCAPLGSYMSGGSDLGPLTYLLPGLTPVHVPAAESRALGAAADCTDITSDQRYVTRPATNCDIGAVQVDLRDLLNNGNFEAGLANWQFSSNMGSKVTSKAAYTGVNGLLIKGGAGALTTLKQNLPVDTLQDGDTVIFGGHLSIKDSVPVNATASITLKYSDGTTDKQPFDLETNGGIYCGCTDFGTVVVDLTGSRTVTRLIVQLKDRTPAKKYYIDYLYVTVESGPSIIRNGTSGLLPPPAAPDGFRGGN